MNIEFLHKVRGTEINSVIRLIRRNCADTSCNKLLEIGAGTGAQAQELQNAGFEVSAIDVEGSNYARQRMFNILNYDGHHIPFQDKTFDVVFSSSVLEHVPHVEAFQAELARVLKDKGLAVHLVPNANWRFWTTLTYYPYAVKLLIAGAASYRAPTPTSRRLRAPGELRAKPLLGRLVPDRHGELGNFLTETWHFRRKRWEALFRTTGWVIVDRQDCDLFYTGHMLFGSAISMRTRLRIARWIGSVVTAFVLRKNLG